MKNVIPQMDRKNEWLLLSTSFTAKYGLVFVLTQKTLFLRAFILKSTERAKVLPKRWYKGFSK